MITVKAGESLQTAVNNCPPGETLSVEAGATFQGPIELPNKASTGVITIQSSRVSELPNGRVDPSHAPLMPKILCPDATQANNPQSITTLPGAQYYKFDGIEVLPSASANIFYELIRFGASRADQNTLGSVPHHLKIDRCYVHGLDGKNFQRGVSLNSSDSEITRSYFSQITGKGMDAQAIASWNTPGRNKIVDCYLEATGENVMFGGSDPASAEFIPSDCQLLRCFVFKPLTWKGLGYTIKNLLEFKDAQRIVVDGNIFQNNWSGEGQAGPCILFTVRNQEGSAPFSIVKDIQFTNNTVKHSEGVFNFLGLDNEKPSQQGTGVIIRNNVFDEITSGPFLTMNGFFNVTLEHNTHLQSKNTMTLYGTPATGFVYRDNVTIEKEYGVFGDGGTLGTQALEKYTPGYVFTGNVVASPYAPLPAGNDYPATVTVGPDYRTNYPLKGADIDQLLAAQAGNTTPPPITPTPPPTTRKVAWPTTESKQDAVMASQRSDGYYPTKNLSGPYMEFTRVK